MSEHHGDDPELLSGVPIDTDNLHVIVRECLLLVRAIRPHASTARMTA